MSKHRHSKPDIQAQLLKLRATYQEFKVERPPRLHADDILRMRTKEERRAALDKVPAEIRHIVEFYVADYFAKRFNRPLPMLAKPDNPTAPLSLPVDQQPAQGELG